MSDALARIRATLAITPQRWVQLALSVPDDHFRERPAPGEWSALECLRHLIDTERGPFPERLEALRDGRDIPAIDQDARMADGASDDGPLALAATFAALRAVNVAKVALVAEHELDGFAWTTLADPDGNHFCVSGRHGDAA